MNRNLVSVMNMRSALSALILFLAVASLISNGPTANAQTAADTALTTFTTRNWRTFITAITWPFPWASTTWTGFASTTRAASATSWWCDPYSYSCGYYQPVYGCYPGYPGYPYCYPSYPYQLTTATATTTLTSYSPVTQTSVTTATVTSTPSPVFVTNTLTLTTATTDTTMETIYGSLMAGFLVLFLATLFLLLRLRPQKAAT